MLSAPDLETTGEAWLCASGPRLWDVSGGWWASHELLPAPWEQVPEGSTGEGGQSAGQAVLGQACPVASLGISLLKPVPPYAEEAADVLLSSRITASPCTQPHSLEKPSSPSYPNTANPRPASSH